MKSMKFKHVKQVLITGLLLFTLWFLWPIYGFLSNQFETARLPWGWRELPTNIPVVSKTYDAVYETASLQAVDVLSERRMKISAPSLSAAVAIDGQLVWAGATGWRDVGRESPATLNTTYRIGSTSKAVTATGLARLVAKGIIDLDVPISTYFKDLPNSNWNEFTPRQLASHTAGLAAYEENNDWVGFYQSLALTSRFDNPKEALSVFDGADILFNSGENFHYSGFDNVLLSAVMQESHKTSFNDIMTSFVFDPLQLEKTYPDYLRPDDAEFAYSYQVKDHRVKLWREVDLSHKLAAGGYNSTPSDLAMIGSAWLNNDFIPSKIRDDFWTPIALANGQVNEQNYALGFRRASWPIKDFGDVTHLNHGGVSKGAQCWLMIVPEYKIVIAISTNRRTEQFFDFADVYVDLLEIFMSAKQVQ